MEPPLISVVIPVYNAEKTIAKCIDSVLAQTYQEFEILLIDDGSTDNSGTICQDYANKDARIRYIKKENGGVSTARNRGIDEAKGEYITFIDSDDWFENNTLETLLSAARKHSADLVIPRTRMVFCKPNGEFEKDVYNDDDFDLVVTKDEIVDSFEKLRQSWALYSTCGRLYKKSLLIQNNVYFDTTVKVLEDLCFNLNYIEHIDSLSHISDVLYNFYVLGIENYAYKRNYRDYIISNEQVYIYLNRFLDRHQMKMTVSQYDFLIGYWILAINSVMNSSDKSSEKRAALKQIQTIVQKHKIYDCCTKPGVDRKYQALFSCNGLLPFHIIYYLKKLLQK